MHFIPQPGKEDGIPALSLRQAQEPTLWDAYHLHGRKIVDSVPYAKAAAP